MNKLHSVYLAALSFQVVFLISTIILWDEGYSTACAVTGGLVVINTIISISLRQRIKNKEKQYYGRRNNR